MTTGEFLEPQMGTDSDGERDLIIFSQSLSQSSGNVRAPGGGFEMHIGQSTSDNEETFDTVGETNAVGVTSTFINRMEEMSLNLEERNTINDTSSGNGEGRIALLQPK